MLLEYQEGNTLLHRMRPGMKLLWGIVIMLWLFVMFQPLHVLALGLALLATAKLLGGLSVLRLLKTVLIFGVAGIGIILVQGLLHPGAPLFVLGPLAPSREGLLIGLAIALRILSIVTVSMILAKTTDPRDIFLSLVNAGVPYRLAYVLFIALRLIPLMEYEAATIRDAQYVRGIIPQQGGLLQWFRQWGTLLVPWIAAGMRRAEQSAVAMEVRAFGLYPDRTYFFDMKAQERGWLFVGFWIVAFASYLALTRGFGM